MNRQQALEWLVENIAKWPVDEYRKRPYGWRWAYSNGAIFLISAKNSHGVITQQDWLDFEKNTSGENATCKHDSI
ncbi:hypothetical protein ZP9_00021 [Shewanella phage ZP9]|nr:hypothetical protein ZP9_00021 [Shewanella phage ZP9]